MYDHRTDVWRQLTRNGATVALVGMLSSRSPSLQGAALTLLALLCAHDECRDQVLNADCMPKLCILLSSKHLAVRAAANALTQVTPTIKS